MALKRAISHASCLILIGLKAKTHYHKDIPERNCFKLLSCGCGCLYSSFVGEEFLTLKIKKELDASQFALVALCHLIHWY